MKDSLYLWEIGLPNIRKLKFGKVYKKLKSKFTYAYQTVNEVLT